MSIFFGSNGADIITPDLVSSTVLVAGFPKRPSNAVDNIYAGGGNDIVAAGGGNDFALLGTGDDVFIWNPGDGSDFVDGEADNDTLIFNGSAANETMTIFADGAYAKLLRDVASITMTLARLETIDIAALVGADTIVVNDLMGTAVSRVNIDLAGVLGGTTGDAQADTVIVNATNGDDVILLSLQGGALIVEGLAARIVVENFDAASDRIVIQGLGGEDIVDATAVGAGALLLTLDGGSGNDILRGGAGNDTLLGGADNDVLLGGTGVDLLDGGLGDDIEIQNTGVVAPEFILTTFGGGGDDGLTVSRNAAGQLLVNGVVQAGKTIANTALIRAFGLDGNDTITLDQANGALPAAALYGGGGNDTVTGGAGGDTLFGQSGNDTLRGQGGNDLLFGGDGNDTLIGGDGNDQLFGEGGDDRMIWNPGDDTDLFEGGDGIDTAEVNGGGGAEQFTVTANGARVRFDRVNPAPFALDIGTTERLVLNMNGGDDIFSATGNLAALIGITVDGGAGNDTVLGSNGADVLLGGDGDDFIDGNQGNDTALLGAGEDIFQWDPGDGSDTVEGQAGTDTLWFNGSAGNEIMEVSANGGRALFTRNLGNIVMDLNGVEVIDVNVLGGTDTVIVNDLSGTDVTRVNIDLAGTIGGTAGDGQPDAAIINATNGNDVVTMSRQADGSALIGGLATQVVIEHFEPADIIRIEGLAGNDTLVLNEANGALPAVTLAGGSGNDALTGGSGGDTLLGGDDDDTLRGQGGNDLLFGGDGNDILTGGDADDQVFGEGGDDRMIWNPGDDTDLFEGGDGTDTAEVNGGGGAEQFTVTANGARVRFDRINPAPFSLDIGTTERLVVEMNGGDDSFSTTGNLAALIQITVDGGAGNDTILGSNGIDTLLGGDGNDFIDGQQGNDVAFLGAGEDMFQWDPGDGSDVVEGQAGTDTLLFNGSGGNEIMEVSANGGRALFTRNLGNIVMDLNDVEVIDVNVLGGTDTVIVNDLTGTDVTRVNVDLAGTIGGTAGDGAADVVIGNGTNGNDIIDVFGAGTSVSVLGLAAQLDILNSEGANDSLVINGLGGDDGITATTLPAGVIRLTLDGGAGNDTILGSQGADTVLGGEGDDFIFGDNGNDVALMGAGDDIFQWDPGDGNDIIEGQADTDTLLFFGSNASENIDISANGGRVIFFRNVANVTMDLNDVERIDFRALGGTDNIVVGDLSGTDVTNVNLDLRGSGGGGDGAADSVTVNATNGADVFGVASSGGVVTVFGLTAQVTLTNAEAANDRLTLNGLGGDDVIDASGLAAGVLQLTLNGGLGDDVFLGSLGNDLINGGDGNDIALMGVGNDTFVWNPGDDNDTLEGQGGTDTLLFNASNAAENIDISANGGRVILFRNVANVVMDLNDVETIDFNALGGADSIVVNDLSGTDLTDVNVNLAGALGGASGDGIADVVTVNGRVGTDIISIVGSGTSVSVAGAAATVDVTNVDAGAIDRLVVNGQGGNDTITATTLAAGIVGLTIDGGAGNDTILGSQGADTVLGGDGDDFVFGDNGNDVALMGAGNDVFQWDPGDGNDIVEGQADTDTLLFFGSNASENIDIAANGGRVIFFRNVANVTMDLNDVERIDYRALGGADNIVVGDLSGTDMTQVNLDLQSSGGGGDGTADTVTVNATNGADGFGVASSGGVVTVFGLTAQVTLTNAEAANDRLTLNGLGGDDVINATGLAAGVLQQLTLNGGLGDDIFLGSAGNDLINGGDGDDVALMGAGDDIFVWNPGDDNDTLEGQAGFDTMQFNGANVAEIINISSNGGRVVFTRNVANVIMDLNDVEDITYNALGGADNIIVNDLSGTDVTEINLNLAGTLGGTAGDGQADTITIVGTLSDDVILVVGDGGAVTVLGLATQVNITGFEASLDRLIIQAVDGDDVIEASGVASGALLLTLDGGNDNDVLVGGDGNDTLLGGDGDDVLVGGPGTDILNGGLGDDIELQ